MGDLGVLAHFNYWIVIALMMTGFYIIMARQNLVKKIIGLNVLQASVILLYITMAKVEGGTAAILLHPVAHEADHGDHDEEAKEEHGEGHDDHDDHGDHGDGDDGHADDGHADDGHDDEEVRYSNVLPHVLMLTAIVVGVATTAVGLALVVRIQEAYGTIEEDEIRALDEASG